MTELFVTLAGAAMVALAFLAARYGADTRPGPDVPAERWAWPGHGRG